MERESRVMSTRPYSTPEGCVITLPSEEKLWADEDCTYFLGASVVDEALNEDARGKWLSLEGNVTLRESNGTELNGRALIARCLGGYCTISIRRAHAPNNQLATSKVKPVSLLQSTWKPARATGKYLVGLDSVCEKLKEKVFADETEPAGLIVIAGTTNSSKSETSRGLIYALLEGGSYARRPHILTLEDPIEKPLFNLQSLKSSLYEANVDYTARQLPRDCPNVAAGLRDALRQKPAVVYIGETRDEDDWKEILAFAGSGHLVITTTHAGSVVETIKKILKAAGAETPADFGIVAGCIRAVIHLVNIRVKGSFALLPAAWIGTTQSRASLVADGLSSILPERGPGADSIGRASFAEGLAASVTDQLLWKEVCRQAFALDLASASA